MVKKTIRSTAKAGAPRPRVVKMNRGCVETENFVLKELSIKLKPIRINNNVANDRGHIKDVIDKDSDKHNLRKLQPKNYIKESILENSSARTQTFLAKVVKMNRECVETENFVLKELSIKLKPICINYDNNVASDRGNIKDVMDKNSDKHNLRTLQPKNYVEESILENSSAHTQTFLASDLDQKKLPVYRRALPKESETNPKNKDLYEFTDFSPKAKKEVKPLRQHRSSILFDKDTHEIMKKLEEKEAKTKKKVARTRKKLEKKKYDRVVEKIVSNVKQKISKNNGFLKDFIHPALNKPKNVNLVQNKKEEAKHGKITHINNFQHINIVVHSSSEVPFNINNSVPSPVNMLQNPRTVTTRKLRVSYEGESDNDNLLDTFDRDPILLQSIGSCDNSVIQNDNDNCFGFDDAPELNTPIKLTHKKPLNIISNVVLKSAVSNIESPQDCNLKPNANSTMICAPNISSPWRADWVKIKRNPHFLSLKNNALPRIDQEMVLDHTLVENYESACKTPVRLDDTASKKSPVQQSILDYVHSNIEKENGVRHGSLYDYEEFISPEKQVKTQDRDRIKGVKRAILGDEESIIFSTPIKRGALIDISNFSVELKDPNSQNLTYFGFSESIQNSLYKTPEKDRRHVQSIAENDKENDLVKPFRFDVDKLISYSKKMRTIRKKTPAEVQATVVCDDQNRSNSSFEVSSEVHSGEIHLFEEPEEMLDNMSPPHVDEARPRRKRLDSCDSDTSECGKKRKRHKKTKLELEQEAWIRDFNKMCEEVQNHELELE